MPPPTLGFIESPLGSLALGKWPPVSCPLRMGRGRSWHWLWGRLWLHQASGHSQKEEVSPGQAPLRDPVLKKGDALSPKGVGRVTGEKGLWEGKVCPKFLGACVEGSQETGTAWQ